MSPRNGDSAIFEDALELHRQGRPGKLEIAATKPLTTQRDLSLAYSPGVAAPCLKIRDNPDSAYDYTAKGNLVAVVSNGTAVLGLGNLGALASKPVMEGKAVLFKRFADIDGIDLEITTEDVEEFVNCVRFLGASFGGINLEDIKGPECFVIEQRLTEALDIPVFHDDQHGTAIIALAGLINACDLTHRKFEDVRVVINGAGAAGLAIAGLLKLMGVQPGNILMCDSKGVITTGRNDLNEWKAAHAVKTHLRTLADAMAGADIFIGVSVKGAVTAEMVKSMAQDPIIFALANPDPEILPHDAQEARPDAIVATGRSDYANQVNNVLGFPYIFRGALDVRASKITDGMKIAAARAIARLAREDVPDEVARAYAGRRLQYGRDYIIPAPFDPRLIVAVPSAVARAAQEDGVARAPIADMALYRHRLRRRLDPTAAILQLTHDSVRANPRRMVFAEGEEETSIRAALAYKQDGYGEPVLIGREDKIKAQIRALGLQGANEIEIYNAKLTDARRRYAAHLYAQLQRKGALLRDCERMVNLNRNVFGALMVAMGDADAMVTGLTRSFSIAWEDVSRVIPPREGEIAFGLSILAARGRTVFIADTLVHDWPEPQELARIACMAAAKARQMGHEPRVAFLSFANFGQPHRPRAQRPAEAVRILDKMDSDFEYDGEMTADVALDFQLMGKLYPFCRLTGPANVLIMPSLHASNISSTLLAHLSGGTLIGPLLLGLEKPVQIAPIGATVSELVSLAVLGAHEALGARP